MQRPNKNSFSSGKTSQVEHIKQFLLDNAEAIENEATKQHKMFLTSRKLRDDFLHKFKGQHLRVVKEIAHRLEEKDSKKAAEEIRTIGKEIAETALKEALTIEESVDGSIYLKQAIWKKLEEAGYIKKLSTEEMYDISQRLGTYIDTIGSQIAFTFHTYYKKAEEQQYKLAAIVNSSDDAIVSKTLQGIITSWNKSAEKLFGYKAKEAIGQPITLIIPKELLSEETTIISNIKQGKRIEHFETVRVRKDGTRIPLSLTISPVKDNTGKVIGASKIARDITDRKQAEDRQKFLEQISSKLVSSFDNYLTLQDIGKLITSYMADYCRIVIVGPDNTIKEIAVNHTDPSKVSLADDLYTNYKDVPESTHGIPTILKSGKAEILENVDEKVLSTFSGNKKLLKNIEQIGLQSYMGVPLIARGKVIGAITFSSVSKNHLYTKRDLRFAQEIAHRIALALDNVRLFQEAQIEIKERKQAESNLKYLAEASKILSSSLDYKKTLSNIAKLAVPQIADWCGVDILENGVLEQVAVAHKDSKKVKWAKELRKLNPPDMESKSGIPQVIRTGQSEYYPVITDAMLVKMAKNKKELKLMREIGFTSAIVAPLCRGGKCIGGITFVTTETKRHFTLSDLAMSEELANRASLALENAGLYKASQEAVALRDDFISVASHELKTPITSVKIFTEVLQQHSQQIGDHQAFSHLTKMNKQLDKLTELIYNMLNISKIQAGRLEFNQKMFDLDHTVSEIVDVLQQGANKHKLVIKGKINKNIYGDEDRIGQVLSNLVSNAIKYSPKADNVVIHLSSDSDSAVVCVEDFGIGLAKEHGERIFERFYRVFDETDKTFPGLGIGLYISSEIVKRHYGKLWVESTAGKGSKFYFSLPLNGHKKANGVQVL